MRSAVMLVCTAACVLTLSARGFSQETPPGTTVLSGVYTTEQAERGRAEFERACATCHRADLSGLSGPPLVGTRFMDRWREFNLNVLYDSTVKTMPKDGPGKVTPSAHLDILAYILQANTLPAGSAELRPDALSRTLLVGKDGPKPLPSSAQVDVVGCLTLDTGSGWFLTRASEPMRTLDSWAVTPAETERAKSTPLGSQLFRLTDLDTAPGFKRETFLGNKVEAKGTLVRQPSRERINVVMVQVVGEGCDQ